MVERVFLGRYQTIRLLGQGGMGCVFLARPLKRRGELVVVKVMHEHIAGDPKFRERFQQEIASMSRFRHPHSVEFIEASLDDPQGPCIVMEYVPGVTLDKLLAKNGFFRPVRLHRIVTQLCEVLQAAHELGIIHRDLKPANLMVVDPDTPFENLKVTDFGLAHMVDSPVMQVASRATPVEYAVGTPGFMSPEQVRGDDMDQRSDLYSVGVILFQLLSGRLPFTGPSTMEILMTQATDEPPTFAAIGLADRVPPEVEAVVRSCLAIDPKDRPGSARELGQQFEEALKRAYSSPDVNLAPQTSPEQAAVKPATEEPPAATDALTEHLEAWMPEQIAKYKLRGFAQAVNGEIVHTGPGVVHLRLKGGPMGSTWLGLSRKTGPIDMELLLKPKDENQPNFLNVTVLMRPSGGGKPPKHPEWHEYCQNVIVTLRAYLMSQA